MIRISGADAIAITESIVDIGLSAVEARYMKRARIHYFGDSGRTIDDALVVVFRAPDSFTGEDVVELHCHGGVLVAKTVMNQLFSAGASAAGAGEFTHRAFLNGRINLTQAEAIGNIIHAKTEAALQVAANSMGGAISREIAEIRAELVEMAAGLLVDMDFAEEGFEGDAPDLSGIIGRLEALLRTADNGIIAQEGLNIAIVGAPNVGKSSLLNALLGENRAIVTDIAGTTRDVLREQANICGKLVNFLDTAGIRETSDCVEKIGVEMAREQLGKADLVLVVLDGSRAISVEDKEILRATEGRARLVVRNKADVGLLVDERLAISAKTGDGIAELCEEIARFCDGDGIDLGKPVIANMRQKQQIQRALEILGEMPLELDAMVTAVEAAIAVLGEIIGENVSEEIVGEIFAKFCVGK